MEKGAEQADQKAEGRQNRDIPLLTAGEAHRRRRVRIKYALSCAVRISACTIMLTALLRSLSTISPQRLIFSSAINGLLKFRYTDEALEGKASTVKAPTDSDFGTFPSSEAIEPDAASPDSSVEYSFSREELYSFDCESIKNAIIPRDMSAGTVNELFRDSETAYTFSVDELLKRDLSSVYESAAPVMLGTTTASGGASPIVLIYHTHGTESYSESGSSSYSVQGELARSENTSENVVAVGSAIAAELELSGIPTIHCEIMHDKESYVDSYNRSKASVKDYMKKYPSLRYVIDIHRDALFDSSENMLRPVTLYNGSPCAQLMFVVGTDWYGASHANFKDNLSLAIKLQSRLNEKCDSLMRPVNIRGSSFNQQLSPGALLLEVGSCGNSLEEATAAGRLFADALAEYILSLS